MTQDFGTQRALEALAVATNGQHGDAAPVYIINEPGRATLLIGGDDNNPAAHVARLRRWLARYTWPEEERGPWLRLQRDCRHDGSTVTEEFGYSCATCGVFLRRYDEAL